MITIPKNAQRVLHNRHDVMWADEGKRKCVVCEKVKLLKMFDPIERTDGVHVLESCYACIEQARNARALTRSSAAKEVMAEALGKAFGRPIAKVDAPSLAEFADKFMGKMGGLDAVAGDLATVTSDALRNVKLDHKVKIKYGTLITNMLSVLHRNQDEPIDLDKLTAAELVDLLMEPAKKAILSDDEFRYKLLSDPAIRKQMLMDMGADLLDIPKEEASDSTADGE